MAAINLGVDSRRGAIFIVQARGKLRSHLSLNEIHRATPEAASGETSADEAGLALSCLDHDVSLVTAGLEVVAIAGVSRSHEVAELFEVSRNKRVSRGDCAEILRDDMTAAAEDVVRHLSTPLLQVPGRRITQEFNFRAMAAENFCSLLHFATPDAILTAGMRVFHHGIGDDEADVGRDRSEPVFQRAAIEQERVVFFAAAGDELVHDAAGSSNVYVFRTLTKFGNFFARRLGLGEAESGERGGYFNGRG